MSSIPPELLNQVFSYCDKATLRQARLANHACSVQAANHLFHTFELHHWSSYFESLLAISKSPLACCVRNTHYIAEALPGVEFEQWSNWLDEHGLGTHKSTIGEIPKAVKIAGYNCYTEYRKKQFLLGPVTTKQIFCEALPRFEKLVGLQVGYGPPSVQVNSTNIYARPFLEKLDVCTHYGPKVIAELSRELRNKVIIHDVHIPGGEILHALVDSLKLRKLTIHDASNGVKQFSKLPRLNAGLNSPWPNLKVLSLGGYTATVHDVVQFVNGHPNLGSICLARVMITGAHDMTNVLKKLPGWTLADSVDSDDYYLVSNDFYEGIYIRRGFEMVHGQEERACSSTVVG